MAFKNMARVLLYDNKMRCVWRRSLLVPARCFSEDGQVGVTHRVPPPPKSAVMTVNKDVGKHENSSESVVMRPLYCYVGLEITAGDAVSPEVPPGGGL